MAEHPELGSSLVSYCWIFSQIGSVVATIVSGIIIETMGLAPLFIIMSVCVTLPLFTYWHNMIQETSLFRVVEEEIGFFQEEQRAANEVEIIRHSFNKNLERHHLIGTKLISFNYSSWNKGKNWFIIGLIMGIAELTHLTLSMFQQDHRATAIFVLSGSFLIITSMWILLPRIVAKVNTFCILQELLYINLTGGKLKLIC